MSLSQKVDILYLTRYFIGNEEEMDMTPHDLETELLKLSPSVRAELAEKLLQSLETLSDQENEKLWAEEALRRHHEILSGKATPVPAETVFHEARKRIG